MFYRWLNRYKEKKPIEPIKKGSFQSIPLIIKKLTPEERLTAIEKVLKHGESVVNVCRDYQISRTNFYKWLKRYQSTSDGQQLLALRDKQPLITEYYCQTPKKLENTVLQLVAHYPQYGVSRIVENLPKIASRPIVGHHGVQNILKRHSLNTHEKRLVYAQAQIGVVDKLIAFFSDLMSPFILLPIKKRSLIIRWLAVVASSTVLTVLIFGSTAYFLRILSFISPSDRLGLIFSGISLGVGGIFFTYSMKYYFTLALVLSFSRNPAEEGGGYSLSLNGEANGNPNFAKPSLASLGKGNGNGLGWLAKIFGMRNGNGNGNGHNGKTIPAGGLQPSLDHIHPERYPFFSIHLPFYNEKKVAERIINACMGMDYPNGKTGRPNYEVVVCDDSNDETVEIIRGLMEKLGKVREYYGKDKELIWQVDSKDKPTLKVLHRQTRSGFKGGALKYALQNLDPQTEFVCVFDADFVLYPDTLEQFLKYFKATGGWSEERDYRTVGITTMPYDTNEKVSIGTKLRELLEKQVTGIRQKNPIAVVAGYQWHVLNKSENWITRGVRTEYAGSYVVERPGQEIMGALKIIHGSVYAIRADVLKHFGWGTSITEDYELTLRIYEKGFKVAFTPYIQAPSECVSTLKRLIRQRMRWAEGHSFNTRKMFGKLMFGHWEKAGIMNNESGIKNQGGSIHNSKFMIRNSRSKHFIPSSLTLFEKLEFLYLAPYYLQAAFFIVGTLSWLISEFIYQVKLPFWTSLWGWSLVLTNFFALPLVNAAGLFLEESEEKDYLGLLSFVLLCYILTPFQAYAAAKGFVRDREGPWFRTPKTGKVTDIFTRGSFYRWISGILPGRKLAIASADLHRSKADFRGSAFIDSQNPRPSAYLALATANNRFFNFSINPHRSRLSGRQARWVSKTALVILLVISVSIFSLARGIPEVLATNPNTTQYLRTGTTSTLANARVLGDSLDTGNTVTGSVVAPKGTALGRYEYQPGSSGLYSEPTCANGAATGYGWILDLPFQDGGVIGGGSGWQFTFYESDSPNTQAAGTLEICAYKIIVSGGSITGSTLLFDTGTDSTTWPSTDIINNDITNTTYTTMDYGSFSFNANEYLFIQYSFALTITAKDTTTVFTGGDVTGSDPVVVLPSITIPENLWPVVLVGLVGTWWMGKIKKKKASF